MSDKLLNDAEEILEHRDDEGEWEEDPEQFDVRPSRSEAVSFRLPVEEMDALEEAAVKNGESLSEYLRKSLALRLHGMPIGPAVEVSSGVSRLTIRSHIVVGTGKENPTDPFVADEPPLTATAL